ncbi:MAG: YgaP-like transmembrane domain [Candidatus Thiodiazotropha sp. LLP2]
MTVERITFTIVGILIMATIGAYISTQNVYFLYASGVVGFMVFQAPFTKFCPLPMILKMMGIPTGSVFGKPTDAA